MKKFALTMIALFLSVVGLSAGFLWYIQPDQDRHLHYTEISVMQKVKEILHTRKPEVKLNEQEFNNIVRKSLKKNPRISKHLLVTGADGTLYGTEYTLHLNLLYYDYVPIGLTMHYSLEWKSPDLVAKLDSAYLKQIKLAPSWLKAGRIKIPVEQQLPSGIDIKQVRFENKAIAFTLQADRYFRSLLGL